MRFSAIGAGLGCRSARIWWSGGLEWFPLCKDLELFLSAREFRLGDVGRVPAGAQADVDSFQLGHVLEVEGREWCLCRDQRIMTWAGDLLCLLATAMSWKADYDDAVDTQELTLAPSQSAYARLPFPNPNIMGLVFVRPQRPRCASIDQGNAFTQTSS